MTQPANQYGSSPSYTLSPEEMDPLSLGIPNAIPGSVLWIPRREPAGTFY